MIMKHNVQVTILLLVFFVIAQILGLTFLGLAMDVKQSETGEYNITYQDTAVGERPDFEPETSFYSIIIAIALGTGLALLLIKFKLMKIWKIWFFLAVFASISISLGTFLPKLLVFAFAATLAILKLFRPNIITQNLSELLIYPGIAIIFVPMLNVFWMFMLLIAISLYDMYAVWKSKHMIKMALFQSKSQTFAGLLIPYQKVKSQKNSKKKTETVTAILGGGDIAFPMLFAGTIMTDLVLKGVPKFIAGLQASSIIIGATIALTLLFFKGKEDRFYPAMPFLTLGCVLGYLFLLIL